MSNTQGTGYHYGLDFVLSHSAEDVESMTARLAKRNRVHKATISEQEKPALRHQLQERMAVRRRKEAVRRRRYHK